MQIVSGVDLLEIDRIARSINNPRFLRRVFSDSELEQYHSRGESASFLTGCFCAKEAFSKALGTGIRGFSLTEVSVLRNASGKPYLSLSGRAKQIAADKRLLFDVSISNTKQYAVAFVVGYTDETEA